MTQLIRRSRHRVAAALVALVALVVPLAPAGAWAADPVRPDPGRPWFGPHLPYPDDTPAAYVDRLGGFVSIQSATITRPSRTKVRRYSV